MDNNEQNDDTTIEIRPAALFAFIKISGMLLAAAAFLLLAWWTLPGLLWLSLSAIAMAWYRFLYIRNTRYTVTSEVLMVRQGIFFKRISTIELFRLKDYIITRSPVLQLFKLMDLMLKSTDPENPVIWLRGVPYSDLVDRLRERVIKTRQNNRIFEIN